MGNNNKSGKGYKVHNYKTGNKSSNKKRSNYANGGSNSSLSYVGAPYNFVPFPGKVYSPLNREQMGLFDKIDDTLLSGEIEYSMTAVTPIYVGSGKNEGNHFFMNENGKYAIPGSTIRGLIRNNVQILSMSSFDDDIDDYSLMYRHVAAGALKKQYGETLGNKTVQIEVGNRKASVSVLENVKAGYIKNDNGDYYIIPAPHSDDMKSLGMPNYYVLSERKIVKNYQDSKEKNVDFLFPFFGDEKSTFLQHMIHTPFKKTVYKGRTHYIGIENKKYIPYMKKCSFEVNGKNITEVRESKECSNEGWAVSSGKMNEKKAVYIIPEIDSNADKIKITSNDIKAYLIDYKNKENTLAAQFKNSKSKAKDYYGLPVNGQSKPVFFIEMDQRIYFGFTPHLRLFYKNSVKKGYRNEKKNGFDLASSIFGMSKNDISYKSKTSFVDAEIVGDSGQPIVNNVVLATPKPTSYLDYIIQDGKKDVKTYNDDNFKLRGVKQYWLHSDIDQGEINNNKNVGTTIKALPSETRFNGVIRFQNLSGQELGVLLWALRLEEGCDMNIGMGKPYGYGRVRVSDIRLKTINNKKAYSLDGLNLNPFDEGDVDSYIEEYKNIEVNGVKISDVESIKSFFKMKDEKYIPKKENVRYMSINKGEYKNRVNYSIPLDSIDEVVKKK